MSFGSVVSALSAFVASDWYADGLSRFFGENRQIHTCVAAGVIPMAFSLMGTTAEKVGAAVGGVLFASAAAFLSSSEKSRTIASLSAALVGSGIIALASQSENPFFYGLPGAATGLFAAQLTAFQGKQ